MGGALVAVGVAQEPVLSVQWSPDGERYALAFQPVDTVGLGRGLSVSYGPVGGLRLSDQAPVVGAGLTVGYDQRRLVAGASLSLMAVQGGPVRPVLGASVGFRL
jgi:hypothetical protein